MGRQLPTVLLVLTYVAALAVALHDPSEHLLAGTVVLVALTARLLVRSPSARAALCRVAHTGRRREPVPAEVVAPAPATPA